MAFPKQATKMTTDDAPEKKNGNLKSYLLEGFMIFIGVTLGFFAESYREGLGDQQKEKDYIHSLISDLKQDSISLEETIKENVWKIKYLDSLISLSALKVLDHRAKRKLYRYAANSISNYSSFQSNDATMLQLKNAGGLQYIRSGHVADSIAMYDQVVRSVYAAEVHNSKAIDDATTAMAELLVLTIQDDTTFFKNHVYTGKELPLLTTEPMKLSLFFNKVDLERGWTQNYVNNLRQRRPYIKKLISLLKRTYSIE